MSVLSSGGYTLADLTTINDSSAKYQMGKVVTDVNGNKFIYALSDATVAAGDAVTVDFTDATDNAQGALEFIQPTTGTLAYFAGIAVGAITAGNYGWFQVYGYNVVPLRSTTVSAGDSLKCVNAANTMVNDQAQGTAPTYLMGFAIATTAATAAQPAAGTIFIRSFFADAG